MNFKKTIVPVLRIFLLPVSVIYGLIIYIRNFLFDKKILHSKSFNLPVICVGNISVGGTGKTPMVEYLIKIFQHQNFSTATISRGYRRKTKGFLLADDKTNVTDIGDEPMQFHSKYPGVAVCVGEDRVNAIEQLLQSKPETEIIILDDAFQHRKIKAGLNILLTDYNNLFYKDCFLPVGNLRDQRSAAKRADIIVVTKCPQSISFKEQQFINKKIDRKNIFFTAINYGNPYHISNSEEIILNKEMHYVLIHGIANANSLRHYLASFDKNFEEIQFNDHHDYSKNDIQKIIAHYNNQVRKSIIITTEKDAVKLKGFNNQLSALPLYILPVEVFFLFNEKEKFDNMINNFVLSFN
ncbi:MAG: tetraacyldisaccharide 4'-kinase [Arachidicoccus sp.]|nr:tetraacyldisaccharide 4'-kinase [Arachidicoccus sp.]